MKSLKLPKQESSHDGTAVADSMDRYGYGTGISFTDDQIEAVGGSGYKVGDKVKITAFATVTDTSVHEDKTEAGKERKSRRLGLQLTDAESSMASSKDSAERMYGPKA